MSRQLIPYRDDDPFREMSRMLDTMRNFVRLGPSASWTIQPGTTQLPINVTDDDTTVTVEAALPGIDEESIDVSVSGDILTISAESERAREEGGEERGWYIRELHYGSVSRSVRLPAEVSADRAEATLENGILTITLPKEQPSESRRITVKAGQKK